MAHKLDFIHRRSSTTGDKLFYNTAVTTVWSTVLQVSLTQRDDKDKDEAQVIRVQLPCSYDPAPPIRRFRLSLQRHPLPYCLHICVLYLSNIQGPRSLAAGS
jgi:hypothetical protein